jgi:hypothetical protein
MSTLSAPSSRGTSVLRRNSDEPTSRRRRTHRREPINPHDNDNDDNDRYYVPHPFDTNSPPEKYTADKEKSRKRRKPVRYCFDFFLVGHHFDFAFFSKH